MAVTRLALLGALVGSAACAVAVEDRGDGEPVARDGAFTSPLRVTRVVAPLAGAHCDIQVEGVGLIEMETDYLPHVIQCENGGAGLEALKAQAISARSVAYYAIETDGSICDSQGCQVYSCAADPTPLAYQAVEETSGIYLMNNSTLTYGFYVAGDNDTAPPGCIGVSGSTEGWVTYNDGRTGTDVEQTALGFVHDPGDFGYGQNRGCMSQWGARCLEDDVGRDYVGILEFYYGADIELVQGEGECVESTGSTGAGEGSSSGAGAEAEAGSAGSDPSTSGDNGEAEAEAGTSNADPTSDPTGAPTGNEPGTDPTGVDPTLAPSEALPQNYGGSGDEGCGCNTTAPSSAIWLLALLGLLRRRRQ